MAVLARHGLRLKYRGGVADESVLSLYDGTTSLQGFAQSLQIVTHAFLNDEVVSRATALKGASLMFRPPRAGSVVFEVIALIERYPVTSTAAVTLGAPVYYDFLKLAYRKACGLFEQEPDTPYVRNLVDKQEPFFDELAENLEGSLQRAHRPVGDTVSGVTLERPRSVLLGFDEETKDWVNTSEENPISEIMTGNMTRFNSVTRNGRVFVDQLGRIVPIRPDEDFPAGRLPLLTWSLHGSNSSDLPKKLELNVKRVNSASGKTKRLLLSDCRRIED